MAWKCVFSSFYSNNSSNKCFVWIQTSKDSELMSLTLLFSITEPFGRTEYGRISGNTESNWPVRGELTAVLPGYPYLGWIPYLGQLDAVLPGSPYSEWVNRSPAVRSLTQRDLESQLIYIYLTTWSNMDRKIHILMRTWTQDRLSSEKFLKNHFRA